MKHLLKLATPVLLALALAACGTSPAKEVTTGANQQTAPAPQSQKKMTDEDIKRFNEYAPNLRGGPFIKSAAIEGDKAIIVYGTFAEYQEKRKGKEGGNTEDVYNDYWKNGDSIRKVLMEESVRLLKEFANLSDVEITTPLFEGKKYAVALGRKAAEDYYKVNLEEIGKDKTNELWRKQVSTPYFTKQGRDDFEKKFIKQVTP